MNGQQRGVVIAALGLFAVTAMFAPHQLVKEELNPAYTTSGSGGPRFNTTVAKHYRPVWDTDAGQLDAATLLTWWVAIAIIGGGVTALLGRRDPAA